MIRNSLFLGTVISLFQTLYRLYLNSPIYRLWLRIGSACSDALDQSVIVGFFRADWDAHTKVGRLGRPVNAVIGKCRTCFAGSSTFARKVQDSLLLRVLDSRCILLVLCITGFSIPFVPTLVLLLGILCAFVLWVLNVLIGRVEVGEIGFVGIFGILFAVCYVVSCLTSPAFPGSLEEMLMFLGLMTVMPVASSVLKDGRRRDVFLTVLILSAVLVSLHGLYQYFVGVEMDPAWIDSGNYSGITTRAYSTFGNPNVMGEYLIALCSTGVGMFWKEKRRRWKIAYFCATVLMAAGLYVTGSRGSLLGLAVSAAVFALFAEHRLIPFGIVAAAAIPFVLPKSILARFVGAITGTDSSTRYRKSIYGACFAMAKDYWLSGIGVDAFALVFPLYAYSASNSYHSHNLFLQIFLELGIVGFVMFAAMMIFWAQRMYGSISKDRTGNRYLSGVILGGMSGLLVQGLTDHLWFNYRIVLLFFLVMGLGLACSRKENT